LNDEFIAIKHAEAMQILTENKMEVPKLYFEPRLAGREIMYWYFY